MKAMILAAGLGTRLQEITRQSPKALVKAGNMSLLERLVTKMKVQGVEEIIINVHHFADQITDFLQAKDHFDMPIHVSDESGRLLDTGGGIFNAAALLGTEAFIVHNVDILSDLDLRSIYRHHITQDVLATLAVKSRKTSRYLLFDEVMRMRGWENVSSGEKILPDGYSGELNPYAFSGIHVISPEIFKLYPREGAFSIIEAYLELCRTHAITGYRHDKGLWIDAGKPDGLKLANTLLGGA